MNINDSFSTIEKYFSPKVIGEVNDQYIKLAKIKGEEIPWHNHENEDEMFFIVKGSLLMEIEGQDAFTMNKDDFHIVKKGVNHRVSSEQECQVMLVESKTTAHTGTVKSDITKSIDDQLY